MWDWIDSTISMELALQIGFYVILAYIIISTMWVRRKH
jgi:hypothetical protein